MIGNPLKETSTSIAAEGTAMGANELPEVPAFWSRKVLGPSAVFTAMAIGSGELVFWPNLTLSMGAGVIWIALVVVGLQYVLNIEIARYSMATGESVASGAMRRWKGWGLVLFLGAIVPWLWPGWARAGAQVLGGTLGLPEKALSIASLLLCGALLAIPNRVYGFVEKLQTILLVLIFVGIGALCAVALASSSNASSFWSQLVTGEGITTLFAESANASSGAFMALLGGIVFAGGGGILNLGYGLLVCEKQFGMGYLAQPISGLRHSKGLAPRLTPVSEFSPNASNRTRWADWISLARREHGLLFLGGNVFSIVLISLMFYALLGASNGQQGMSFLITATDRFEQVGGQIASLAFVALAFAIFFTSELGILDITSRIGAGLLSVSGTNSRFSPSTLYHLLVWTEIGIGIALIVVDTRQPYWFLVTSGVLNTVVMATYAGLVALLNRQALPLLARPSQILTIALWGIAALYALLFVVTMSRM